MVYINKIYGNRIYSHRSFTGTSDEKTNDHEEKTRHVSHQSIVLACLMMPGMNGDITDGVSVAFLSHANWTVQNMECIHS